MFVAYGFIACRAIYRVSRAYLVHDGRRSLRGMNRHVGLNRETPLARRMVARTQTGRLSRSGRRIRSQVIEKGNRAFLISRGHSARPRADSPLDHRRRRVGLGHRRHDLRLLRRVEGLAPRPNRSASIRVRERRRKHSRIHGGPSALAHSTWLRLARFLGRGMVVHDFPAFGELPENQGEKSAWL